MVVPPEVTERAKPDPSDMDAVLSAAIAGDLPDDGPSFADDALPPTDDAAPTAAEAAPREPAADGRARDEHGRFAPKTEAAPGAPVETKPDLASTDAAKATVTPDSTPADAPPAGWTPDAKAAWSTLPPSVKAAALKREAEIDAGGRQWSEEKRRFEGMLGPIAQQASRRGMSAEQGLQSLAAAQEFLDRDPHRAIAWLAQSYGVNLATLAGPQGGGDAQPTNDQAAPSYGQADIAALVRQYAEPIVQQSWQEREQFAQQQALEREVQQFAAAKPHAQAVMSEWAGLVWSYRRDNPDWSNSQVLEASYNAALQANPQIRQSLTHAAQAEADAKRKEADAARVTRARSAAASVTGAPSSATPGPSRMSLDDAIAAAIEGR